MTSFIISFAAGGDCAGLCHRLIIYILRQDEGNELMREIGKAIQEGLWPSSKGSTPSSGLLP